jgi:proteasome lid subunit RPN8/RPN11
VIVLPEDLRRQIERHGADAYPDECCGALLGRVDAGGAARVERVERLANARTDERRRRYRIDPADYLRVERLGAADGLELVGFYHSHPDHPGVPSEYDRERALPFFHYLVLAVEAARPADLGAFVLSEDRATFRREKLTASHAGGS